MKNKYVEEAAKEFYKHYILVGIYRRRLAETPIVSNTSMSESTLRMLDVVREQKECSLKRLCRIIGLSIPAGSIMVEKAVEKGLVYRRSGKSDRRKIYISLTDEGEKTIYKIRNDSYNLFGEAFSKLSDSDLKSLISSMQEMSRIFDKIDLSPEEK